MHCYWVFKTLSRTCVIKKNLFRIIQYLVVFFAFYYVSQTTQYWHHPLPPTWFCENWDPWTVTFMSHIFRARFHRLFCRSSVLYVLPAEYHLFTDKLCCSVFFNLNKYSNNILCEVLAEAITLKFIVYPFNSIIYFKCKLHYFAKSILLLT